MSRYQQLIFKLKRRHLLTSVAFAIVSCGICFYVFNASGPINNYWHTDLSFLLLPLMGYYGLRLFSRLCGSQIRSFWGKVAANALNGLAFSFASFFLFSQALLFTRIPAMANAQTFFTEITLMAPGALLFFGGYTVYKIARILTDTPRDRLISPSGAATGQILMGIGLWQCLASFSPSWPPASGIGLIIFVALSVLAVSNLGSYGQDSINLRLADASHWLKDGSAGKFFLAGFIATYLIFVRPAIFSNFSYAYLVEWLVFCFISWRIFSSLKSFLQKRYSKPIQESNWQKHIQEVFYLADEDFVKLVVLQKDYVENGDRRNLLEYMKTILIENDLHENEIVPTLSPIMEHKDVKAPWYTFGFLERRFTRLNRQNRRSSLKNTMLRLVAIAFPSR